MEGEGGERKNNTNTVYNFGFPSAIFHEQENINACQIVFFPKEPKDKL